MVTTTSEVEDRLPHKRSSKEVTLRLEKEGTEGETLLQ